MELTNVYRLWQAPFAERKLRPFLDAQKLAGFDRVLDVGCGPGTNAGYFTEADYLGVDINPEYIRHATSRFGPRFQVVDVTSMRFDPGEGFDCILVNSLLHHLADEEVDRLLSRLRSLLAVGGAIHVLDLVLPERPGIACLLARLDRGRHPRRLATWEGIFGRHFDAIRFEPYPLDLAGIVLWQMVYFQGRARE